MIGSDKAVTLMFLDQSMDYDIENYTSDRWDPSWYYLVQQMPILEMMGKTPTDITEEFIQLTTTPEWLSRQRRQMRLGDLVCYAGTPYVLVRMGDSEQAVKLAVWPDYGLIKLKDEKVKPMLCE